MDKGMKAVRQHSGASIGLLALLVFTLCGTSAAFGQQITGTILGTVQDAQGAVISTATVKATNVDTGFSRSAPTNDTGEYRIDYLPVGTYTVEATASGFARYVRKSIALDVDQKLTVEIKLSVGAATQTVTVTEAPPVINTSDAVLGRTLEPNEINNLPLVNRNTYGLISLTPGVMANNNSSTSNPSGNPTFATGLYIEDVQINGSIDGGSAGVAFYLDGGNNITGMRNYGNPSPNPDAVEEFRVETSAFGAQYGQFSAGVVSVITKSGTNQWHGGLFEFNRNTLFNANTWAPAHNAAGQIIVSPYHRNQFGGDFGGPVKKDKAFFFFSYGGLRQVTSAVFTGAITPTANERLGDFTADTFKVNTPGTKTQVIGTNSSPNCQVATLNCIPQALLDTTIFNLDNVSNKIGSSIPLPNGALNPAKGGGAYSGLFPIPTQENEYLGKYDQNLGAKDHVAVTYFYSKNVLGNNPGGNVPWTINNNVSAGTNINLSDIHTFTSGVANQAWLTYTRAAGGRVNLPFTGPASQTLASYGSNFVLQGPPSLPTISETNFSATATNAGPFTGSDNYELRDMVSITKGKHSLSIGGEFALDKTMFDANLLNFGSISFATSAPTSTGNVTSDWVTGQASATEQDSPYTTHLSTWHIAAFFQDDYRITPRFTANLGIRWDIDTPPTDAINRTASFVPGQQSTVAPAAPKGIVFPGDAGIGRGIIGTKFYHVSPRLGFAFDPFGDGKTSIRGAAGIFYGIVAGNEWNQPGNAIPFALRPQTGEGPLSGTNAITNYYSTPGDFPSTAPGGGLFPYTYTSSKPTFITGPGGAVETISPHFKYPYVYQFNLSVQRQLPGRTSLTAAYVGALSHQLPNFIDVNYAPYSTVFGGPTSSNTGAGNVPQRRQFDPCIGSGGCPTGAAAINNGSGQLGASITQLMSNLTASYHSLQISATKQLSGSFSASGFYVWSHALEIFEPDADGLSSPQDSGYFGTPFTASNNSLGAVGGGLQEEYGPMNADLRHNAGISATWNIDYFHGDNKILKEVANGWQIAPIIYLHSGGPFNVTTGANKSFDSTNNQRPNYNTVTPVSPVLDPHRCRVCATNSVVSEWFNTAAFTANGPPGGPAGPNPQAPAGGIGPGLADGNVSRNSLYGPGFKDVDLGVFRNINFERGIVFQLRGEATNIFNLVSLANPTASLASANYGKITSATGTQRILQVGGRLTF
jgi:hypothetical protein